LPIRAKHPTLAIQRTQEAILYQDEIDQLYLAQMLTRDPIAMLTAQRWPLRFRASTRHPAHASSVRRAGTRHGKNVRSLISWCQHRASCWWMRRRTPIQSVHLS